ncbi:hypothetical protein [Aeromicrobium sp.]|uniref:hypothetical protein n=1 Tax=Aeromicrobium sp. TaxID=1871063 RepID=UPI0030C4A7B2
MTTTTLQDLPVLRELPVGHDDKSSPYYLKPEHRDAFQRVSVTARAIASMVDTVRWQITRDRELEIWEANRARKEAVLDPSTYRTWLARHIHSDGRPNLATVGDMPDSSRFGPDASQLALTPDQQLLPEFYALREAATSMAEGYDAAIQEERRRIAARTCEACKALDEDRPLNEIRLPDGAALRMCDECKTITEFLTIATASVPAGGNRFAVVERLVGSSAASADETGGADGKGGLRRLLSGGR